MTNLAKGLIAGVAAVAAGAGGYAFWKRNKAPNRKAKRVERKIRRWERVQQMAKENIANLQHEQRQNAAASATP